jgi:hypothetical protein
MYDYATYQELSVELISHGELQIRARDFNDDVTLVFL